MNSSDSSVCGKENYYWFYAIHFDLLLNEYSSWRDQCNNYALCSHANCFSKQKRTKLPSHFPRERTSIEVKSKYSEITRRLQRPIRVLEPGVWVAFNITRVITRYLCATLDPRGISRDALARIIAKKAQHRIPRGRFLSSREMHPRPMYRNANAVMRSAAKRPSRQ